MIITAVAFVAGFLLGEVWRMVGSGGSTDPRSRGIIGKVGTREIKTDEFRNAVAYITDKYRNDNNLRDLSANDYAAIEAQSWQFLLGEITWGQLLTDAGVGVTQDEILEIMKANPPAELRNNPELLDEEGNFDQQKYLEVMNNPQNQMFFQSYFQDLARMLPKEKLRIDMVNSYRPTSGEIAYRERAEGNQYRVTSLYFGPRALTEKVEPTDDEVQAYYDSHQDDFRKDAVRHLRYISFPRVITPDDSAEAKEMIDRAHVQLQGDESFNLTMLDFSDLRPETLSAYFARDRFDAATDSLVGTLKIGEPSGPYLTPYGWQIVVVDSSTADSAAIRRILVRITMSSETVADVRENVSGFLDFIDNADFDSLADTKGFKVLQARPMVGDEPQLAGFDLVNPQRLIDWALKAEAGDIMPDPARGRDGYYVFQLDKYEPSVLQEYEQVKKQVSWRVKQAQEKEIWLSLARGVREQTRSGTPLDSFAGEGSKYELLSESFGGITDCRRRKGPEFAGAVLALEPGQTSGVVETNWGAFIIRLDGRQSNGSFDPGEYAQERQQQVSQELMKELLETPEVEDYRDPFSY